MSMTESERRAVNDQLRHRGPASHDAWRVTESGYQSTPCWCAGRSWHRIGNEVAEPAEGTGQPTNQTTTGSPSGGPSPLEGT